MSRRDGEERERKITRVDRATIDEGGRRRETEVGEKKKKEKEGRREKKKVTVKEHIRGKKKPALAASADVTTYR